jgi:hypothetical protein
LIVQRAAERAIAVINSEVVVDGTMISARAYPDHPAWTLTVARKYRT